MEVYEVSGLFAYVKHQLSNFVQVVFFGEQNEEKEFAWTFDTSKHHFIDITKVVS
jgi:hypothetical protein